MNRQEIGNIYPTSSVMISDHYENFTNTKSGYTCYVTTNKYAKEKLSAKSLNEICLMVVFINNEYQSIFCRREFAEIEAKAWIEQTKDRKRKKDNLSKAMGDMIEIDKKLGIKVSLD